MTDMLQAELRLSVLLCIASRIWRWWQSCSGHCRPSRILALQQAVHLDPPRGLVGSWPDLYRFDGLGILYDQASFAITKRLLMLCHSAPILLQVH